MDAFYVQGHVIIISDNDDKKMYTNFMKKNRQKDKNGSDESSKVDYDELMRDANAVAIKDDNNKGKIQENEGEKKEKVEHDSDAGVDQMMAEGNVIVIGGEGNGNRLFAE